MGPGDPVGEAAEAAALAAYMFVSSWALTMFFLYRIRLLPNQLQTWFTVIPHWGRVKYHSQHLVF